MKDRVCPFGICASASRKTFRAIETAESSMDAVFRRREHTSETDSPLRLRSSVAGAKGRLCPAREGCDDLSYNG
jgi:hypothetical protein